MQSSFTDFKLRLGVSNEDRDTEYAGILRGLIKELYTVWGIAITQDILQHTETVNSAFDVANELSYKNLTELSITSFTEGVDYTVDYEQGTLTILSTGAMSESTDYTVTYSYYFFLNESNEVIYDIYPEQDVLSYHIDVKPVELIKAEYDGNELVQESDFYFYRNTFEIVTTPASFRKPYRLYFRVGYETMPEDLKMAFYELAQVRFDIREKKTYLISRVDSGSDGTTTSFRDKPMPHHVKEILHYYTGRRFVL